MAVLMEDVAKVETQRAPTPLAVRIALPLVVAALLVIGTALATIELSKDDPVARVQPQKGALIDTFSNTEGETGPGLTDNGRPWAGATGDWKVIGGRLGVTADPKSGASLVVADTGSPNFTVRVEVAKVVSGAGLVFRYAGPNNYWSLTAAPNALTWTLTNVTQGKRSVPIKLGKVHVSDGTTIGVTTSGGQIIVFVDDVEIKTLNDDASSGATRVGLIASGPDRERAAFDNFTAIPSRRLRDVLNTSKTTTTTTSKSASTATTAKSDS